MGLFFVAGLLNPTEKERREGKLEKLIFGPETMIAKDANSAGLKALHQLKDSVSDDDLDRLDIRVSPF